MLPPPTRAPALQLTAAYALKVMEAPGAPSARPIRYASLEFVAITRTSVGAARGGGTTALMTSVVAPAEPWLLPSPLYSALMSQLPTGRLDVVQTAVRLSPIPVSETAEHPGIDGTPLMKLT